MFNTESVTHNGSCSSATCACSTATRGSLPRASAMCQPTTLWFEIVLYTSFTNLRFAPFILHHTASRPNVGANALPQNVGSDAPGNGLEGLPHERLEGFGVGSRSSHGLYFMIGLKWYRSRAMVPEDIIPTRANLRVMTVTYRLCGLVNCVENSR